MSDIFPVVGIGASAGGLEAISELLACAGREDPMAYVIVQHLDPDYKSLLAELLGRKTQNPVSQVDGGEIIEPGHVYVIPPGKNLRIDGDRLLLESFVEPRGLRRPIDDFFISLAEQRGADAACVILSGTGADGTLGLRSIKEHGGVSVVQSPETAGYDGMPTSAVATGLVDYVCDSADIIPILKRYFETRDADGQVLSGVDGYLDALLEHLSVVSGHDFTGYKSSTVRRRVERRMQIVNLLDPARYTQRVKDDLDESAALFRDLLINVTRFFRDPELFDVLERQVIRPLVMNAKENQELRVWVPGCSSGEEAYSIAMLLADAAEVMQKLLRIRVFATDIDTTMLAVAREGRYPSASFIDIPERLRSDYTVADGQGFRIAPSIRGIVRFSEHNVLKHAPFSRLDLVSCRNLLIYFEPRLQQVVLPLFHYALKSGAALFLGSSESIGRFEDLFEPIDRKARLFSSRGKKTNLLGRLPFGTEIPRRPVNFEKTVARPTMEPWEEGLASRRILDTYAPPSVIVDTDGGILATNGQLSRFFEFRVGRFSPQFITSLARPGLREVLTPLLKEIVSTKKRMVHRDLVVRSEFGSQRLDLYADPLPDDTILLVFKTDTPFEPMSEEGMLDYQPGDSQIEMLEDELRLTRYRLRGTVEELETANEELKSSNEEMMLMNEELQSTNEELTTVNDELKDKIDQLVVANADLRNFFEATQMVVVVLDRDLCVRSYTESAISIFPLRESDKGRALSHVSSVLSDTTFIDDAKAVVEGRDTVIRQVVSYDGRKTWSMRVAPYRTGDGAVDGVTMTFSDVTEELALQSELDSQRRRLEMALSVAGIGVWEYLIESGETRLDDNERRLLGLGPDDDSRADSIIARIHPDDRPEVESRLRRALSGEREYEVLFRINDANGEQRYLRGLGRVIEGETPIRMVGVNIDVTAEQTLEQARATMVQELNHRVKNLFAVVNGMIALAAQQVEDKETLVNEVRQRVGALARAHSLTQPQCDIQPVELKALVEIVLEPFRDVGVVAIQGEAVAIDADQVVLLALILHEWVTNAVKYGALSDAKGRLEVSWSTQPSDAIAIRWKEVCDRPPGAPGGGTGFGSTLVEMSTQQLRGSLSTADDESARTMVLTLPLSAAP